MKLSEAMKLGSLVTRQGRGMASLFSSDEPCALGAALKAIGRQPAHMWMPGYRAVQEVWPWTLRQATCPACPYRGTWVGDIIWRLNDEHRWTREQIADWVAVVEPHDVQELPTFTDHEYTTNPERTPA